MLAFRPSDEKNPAGDFMEVGDAIVRAEDEEELEVLAATRVGMRGEG